MSEIVATMENALKNDSGEIIQLNESLPFDLAIDSESGEYGYLTNDTKEFKTFGASGPDQFTIIYEKLKNASDPGLAISESEWIYFVNNDGIKYIIDNNETSLFLNKCIAIYNSIMINTVYEIAGFNHDDTVNTVDLIMLDTTVVNSTYASDGSKYYSNSNMHSYCSGTFPNGFNADIKELLQIMTISTNGTTITGKAKLPSLAEIGKNVSGAPNNEGTKYPMSFTKRVRKNGGNTYSFYWVTRTKSTSGYFISVRSDFGATSTHAYNNSPNTCVFIIRFAKPQ